MNIYFSQNIKLLRESADLTKTEVAKSLGLSLSAVSALEHQTRMPSIEVALQIVEFFNCNMHDLFFKDMSEDKPDIVEENLSLYTFDRRIAARMEKALSELERRIVQECPDCAKKLNIL